jgi:hypothetical protein
MRLIAMAAWLAYFGRIALALRAHARAEKRYMDAAERVPALPEHNKWTYPERLRNERQFSKAEDAADAMHKRYERAETALLNAGKFHTRIGALAWGTPANYFVGVTDAALLAAVLCAWRPDAAKALIDYAATGGQIAAVAFGAMRATLGV